MATGSILNITLPNPGAGGTPGPTWASELIAALTTLDQHAVVDAASGKVLSSGINVNASLEFNDNRATEVKGVQFQSQSGSLTSSLDLRMVHVSGGDLYYTNGSGQRVQVTSAGQLALASAGGIVGDYSGSTARFGYDSPNTEFWGAQAISGPSFNYAGFRIGDLTLLEKGTLGITAGVKLKSPTGMGSTKTFTLFGAVPAEAQLVTLSTGGALSGTSSPSVVSLRSTTGIQTDASGSFSAGVKFSAASTGSHRLTFFEEGTWQPTLFVGGVAHTGSYGTRIGEYQRVGNWVTVMAEINANGPVTASSQAVHVYGLPYSASFGQNFCMSVATFDQGNSVTGSGLDNPGGVQCIVTGQDKLQFCNDQLAASGSFIIPTVASFRIRLTGQYKAT